MPQQNLKLDNLWEKALSEIKDTLGEGVFELWFKPIKLKGIRDNTIYFELPNRFYREWIEDNYPDIIADKMYNLTGVQYAVKYKMQEKTDTEIRKIESKNENRRQRLASRGIYLNPKYTFRNFIVGSSNEFSHAAALKVAENPGRSYNPLFIYGGSGLGKTHLLNAIGNEIFDRNPAVNIYNKSIDVLTNELVTALRHGKTGELLDLFRPVDVFLVDDIHFIAGKEGTQVQFFHIFNALYENQKQIVLTSDRPPVEITDISDRLRSRFNMGLIADIQPPDIETKVAILYKKAENEGLLIPEDVAYFISSRIKSNMRDLEGCLVKLGAHASLTARKIDIETTKEVLKELISEEERPVTAEFIQRLVCDCFNIKLADLKAKKRTKEIANARQTAMYLCKRTTRLSLSEIGRNFGGKDHATVIYGCKQIEEKMSKDEQLKRIIEGLVKKITN